MPGSLIELKNTLQDLDLNPGRREPSAHQALWPIVAFSAFCHEDRHV